MVEAGLILSVGQSNQFVQSNISKVCNANLCSPHQISMNYDLHILYRGFALGLHWGFPFCRPPIIIIIIINYYYY